MEKEIIRLALLKEDNLVDLLTTAFYGSYWFSARIPDEYKKLVNPDSECREEKWADVLKKGGKIMVIDWEEEDENESEHLIDLNDICKGLMKLHNEHLHVYARVMTFDGDADYYDADAVIQYAIFGEWVYG